MNTTRLEQEKITEQRFEMMSAEYEQEQARERRAKRAEYNKRYNEKRKQRKQAQASV